MICLKLNLSVSDVLINALFARYFKKTGIHHENVVSHIANPFERIGF
ncbi:hypothetical protein JW835_02795 [bacterium]|nr:hypothetical protein [bacterium]